MEIEIKLRCKDADEAIACLTNIRRRDLLQSIGDATTTQKAILQFITENPDCSYREIADSFNFTTVNVCKHIASLMTLGLIEKVRINRTFRLRIKKVV